MKYIKLVLPPLMTNSYIIYNKDGGDCYIVDPASSPQKLVESVSEKSLTPLGILLTHAHFDHIGACDALREKYKIPLYLHEADAPMLKEPELNCSAHFMGNPIVLNEPDIFISDNNVLSLENEEIKVIHTPGHSPGSLSFLCGNFLLSGDTIFKNSYGRFDLPGGNLDELKTSIAKLLALDEGLIVCSGHNGESTIKDERGFYRFKGTLH